MRYSIFFIALSFLLVISLILASCDGAMQSDPAMRQDVIKVVEHFCKSQQKQMEISQKMSKYKESGQLPGEELNADIEESNKHLETYTNALQALMEKYKGQERAVYGLLKEGQLKCKY
jgi:septum formation topological specificity factor MinE